MNCPNCGYNLSGNEQVCPVCGAQTTQQTAYDQNAYAQQPMYDPNAYAQQTAYDPNMYAQQTYVQQGYVQPAQTNIDPETLPEQYRPLSAWAYFGLQLLYSVPIVGFIFLIIFSFNGSNINRRSHARSQWIPLFIFLGLFIILLVIFGAGLFAMVPVRTR